MKFIFQRRYPRKLREQGLARMDRAEVEKQFFTLLDALEVLFEGRPALGGMHIGIADISVGAQLDELCRTSDLRDRVLAHPRIKAWLAKLPPA
jgi:glutathione S-transferase